MARTRRKVRKLDTIWECPDELWDDTVRPLVLKHDPPKGRGRKRIDPRKALDGMIHQGRSGCQWNRLPTRFGSDRSIHRTFQRWVTLGLFVKVMAAVIERCDELGGVDWQWQSVDGALGKARLGGTMWVPTPRIAGKTAPNAA
jgi:putative transposase